MFLLAISAVLASVLASSEACKCVTTGVNVRSSACGTVLGGANAGDCFSYLNDFERCSLDGTYYTFEKVDYGAQGGWIANDYLTDDDTGRCTDGGDWDWETGNCGSLQRVSREEWGARPPSSNPGNIALPTYKLFIHHTVTAHCTTQSACESIMRSIQNYHMDSLGWSDIGYNWLVGEDGRAYEGRGWEKVGAHTSGFNSVGVAISVIGDFTGSAPAPAGKSAIENLIACARNDGILASTYKMWGHRDAVATACPGDAFYPQVRRHPNYCTRPPSTDNPSKPC